MKATSELERRYLAFPREVHTLVMHGTGSWIVGSTANMSATPSGRDYDILVPFRLWKEVSSMLPHIGTVSRLTRFGGLNMTTRDGVQLDVWPDDLDRFMVENTRPHAWHPKSGRLLQLWEAP
jgi:hypothetical protein